MRESTPSWPSSTRQLPQGNKKKQGNIQTFVKNKQSNWEFEASLVKHGENYRKRDGMCCVAVHRACAIVSPSNPLPFGYN